MKNPFKALMPQSQINTRQMEVNRKENTKYTSFYWKANSFLKN